MRHADDNLFVMIFRRAHPILQRPALDRVSFEYLFVVVVEIIKGQRNPQPVSVDRLMRSFLTVFFRDSGARPRRDGVSFTGIFFVCLFVCFYLIALQSSL